MLASTIITEVSEQLNDTDFITWTESMLIGYINSAQRAIASVRPDASTVTESFQLAAGTKQDLPAAALRLLEVTRNMGFDGSTPGQSIRGTDYESLSLFNRNWHEAPQATVVNNFTYSEKTPRIFYVDPPADGTRWVEIHYSVLPANISASFETLALKDIYQNHIVQWCMFKAYSVEADSAISRQRALEHQTTFWNMLGRKFGRDAMYSPSEEVQSSLERQEGQGGG